MRDKHHDKPLQDHGASLDGASGGAMGGLSKADLKRGYKRLGDDPERPGIDLSDPHDGGGFAGRARGWER